MSRKQTIFVLRGIPGSGKTTEARKILAEVKNSVRISREDMRAMMHTGLPWMHKEERAVIQIFNKTLFGMLENGKSVIIDDINMNKGVVKSYKNLAEEYGCDFKLVEMNMPIEQCIARDAARDNPVGKTEIMKIAYKYGMLESDYEFVIYGLDNCLVDISDRLACSTSTACEFLPQVFYDPDFIDLDKPNSDVLQSLMKDHADGKEIFLLTSRPSSIRKATEDWLDSYSIPYDRLIMRLDEDTSSDHDFKEKVCKQYLNMDHCRGITDDGPLTISMWKSYHWNVKDIGQSRKLLC